MLVRSDNALFVVLTLGGLVVWERQVFSIPIRSFLRRHGASVVIIAATFIGWLGVCHTITGDWAQTSALMKKIFRSMETAELNPIKLVGYSLNHFGSYLGGALVRGRAPLFW